MKLIALALAMTCVVAAQDFLNLDFELCQSQIDFDGLKATPADRLRLIPGWDSYSLRNGQPLAHNDGFSYPFLWVDGACLGSPCIAVLTKQGFSASSVIGKYALRIDSGGGADCSMETGIRQTGLVPTDAKSLVFQSDGWHTFRVSLDGQVYQSTPISQKNGFTTYAVDVSPYAGRVVELRLSEYAEIHQGPDIAAQSVGNLDGVRFSTVQLVPEPATYMLLGVGGAACWMFKRLRSAAYLPPNPTRSTSRGCSGGWRRAR
jgi:hypothetical protein